MKDPDPYLCLTDPGGPKTYESYKFESGTLNVGVDRYKFSSRLICAIKPRLIKNPVKKRPGATDRCH